MRQTASANGALVGVFGVEDPVEALASVDVRTEWSGPGVAFGGCQVWRSVDGSVVSGGEVVLDNLSELRARLDLAEAEPGELVAQLFECFGTDAGQHGLGMFGVALWDERRKSLTLLRDAVGARTMYYSRQGGACWFSTRLSALRRCPGVSGDLSLTALRNYLTCAFVPGEETLYRDIRELRPGEAITLPGEVRRRYWSPSIVESGSGRLETHAARLRPLLEECVRVRLPKSGEIGVLLSGGLDSSVITALAAREAPGSVHTFAIHFGEELPNELEFSSLVASHCGTNHHVLELPGRKIRDTLIETMGALDDPIGDPLTTPNLLLARAVKEVSGVALNGEGGDPCFGGPKNLPMVLHSLYGSAESREAAYLRSFQKCYDDLPRMLTGQVHNELRNEPPQETILAPYFEEDPDRPMSYLDRLMMINVQMKGADQILTKVNNLFSAAGVVARSPLFDRRIVEAGFAIPAEFKLDGAVEKAVLKAAARHLLPEAILERPKSGMLVPVQRWFKKELKSYARGMLLSRRSRIRPYLEQSLIKEWLSYDGAVWQRNGVKLWLVLALEAWLRAHEG